MPKSPSQSGVTLAELLVTLSLVTLLLTLAAPSLGWMFERNRDAVALNELIGILRFARAQAIMQPAEVVLCPRNGDTFECLDSEEWGESDLMVLRDDDGDGQPDGGASGVLRVQGARRGIARVATREAFRFDADGMTTTGRIGNCKPGEVYAAQQLLVWATGHVQQGGEDLACPDGGR